MPKQIANIASTVPAPTTPSQSLVLTLPAELRVLIFEFVHITGVVSISADTKPPGLLATKRPKSGIARTASGSPSSTAMQG